MIKKFLRETLGTSENCHSIPVIGTIWSGSGSEVDEEIIIEGHDLSSKFVPTMNHVMSTPIVAKHLSYKTKVPNEIPVKDKVIVTSNTSI